MWKASEFVEQKKGLFSHIEKKGFSSSIIAEFCAMSGIPVIVAYQFIMEDFPEHLEFCQEKIARVKDFYGIEE